MPLLDCEWIQSIRTGLATIEGHVKCPNDSVFKVCREAACNLMDDISENKRFTRPEIRQINACQLFLKVTLLSDIMTACGRHIHQTYYQANNTRRHNWATVKYPRQERPDKTSWAFWRRALNDHYLRDDKKTLRQPLGQWHNPEPYHHKWAWNYSLDDIIHQDQVTNAITSHPFIESV